MPRIKDQFRDTRRAQILAGAASRFAVDGFHRTSMQDVIEQAGLSPGAVYRYFRGKDEIIAAIAVDAMGVVESAVTEALDTGRPLPELVGSLPGILSGVEQAELRTRLAVQAWGELLRNPELARTMGDALEGVRAGLARRVARAQADGTADAALDPDDVARVLLAIAQGFLLQHAWAPSTVTPARFGAAVTAVVAGDLNLSAGSEPPEGITPPGR